MSREVEQMYASLVPGKKKMLPVSYVNHFMCTTIVSLFYHSFVVLSPAGHVAAAGSACVGNQADTSRIGKVIG